jgi:hypothetical protein
MCGDEEVYMTTPTPEELAKRHYKCAIVDADSLLYKAAASGTRTYYTILKEDGSHYGEFERKQSAVACIKDDQEIFGIDTSGWEIIQHKEDRGLEYAKMVFHSLVKGIKQEVSADRYRLFIGEGKLDREDTATLHQYKGNRLSLDKPEHFYAMKDYVKSLPDTTIIHNIEVDDAVSTMMWYDYWKNGLNPQFVLLAVDKDLLNSPGPHFSYTTGEWVYVTEEEADWNFATQMLSGDKSTDNIKGLDNLTPEMYAKLGLPKRNGVGKNTAEKILADMKGKSLAELYRCVLEFYKDFYGESYTYKAWTGETMTKTAEEILDENCELLFMQRKKGQRWLQLKEELGL